MSEQATRAMRLLSGPTPIEKLILLLVADVHETDAWPTILQLATWANLPEWTVRRTLRALVAKGLIEMDYGPRRSTELLKRPAHQFRLLPAGRAVDHSAGARKHRLTYETASGLWVLRVHPGFRPPLTAEEVEQVVAAVDAVGQDGEGNCMEAGAEAGDTNARLSEHEHRRPTRPARL